MKCCGYVGCNKTVFVDPVNGRVHEFCSRRHAQLYFNEGTNKRPKLDLNPDDDSALDYAIALSLQENVTCHHNIPQTLNRQFPITSSIQSTASGGFHDADLDAAIALSLQSQEQDAVRSYEKDSALAAQFAAQEEEDHILALSLLRQQEASTESCINDTAVAESLQEQLNMRDAEQAAGHLLAHPSLVHWTCAVCLFAENSKKAPLCAQCKEPRDRTWACTHCTFDNVASDAQCSMCGTSVSPHQVPCSSSSSSSGSGTTSRRSSTQCGLPGCIRPALYYGFCTEEHRERAIARHLLPPAESDIDRVLMGPSGGFTAHLLMATHPRHGSVKAQFLDSWEKPLRVSDPQGRGAPRVERIFWIQVSPQLRAAFDIAKATVGNVCRHFHGTSQAPSCFFGTDPSKPPCKSRQCNVCSISTHSFDRERCGTATRALTFLRYGRGLYFSPISSKSHDYNEGSRRVRPAPQGKSREWRCMFLCTVAVGKPFRTQEGTLPAESCPPVGFDSVMGERGNALNYEEVVVYDQTRAIPSYLIVYSTPL